YTPPGLPLLITGVLFIDWVFKSEKQLGPRWICWLVLVAVIASGILFAPNTYSAAFEVRRMGMLFLGVCLPMQGLLNSLRRLRWWLYAFILIAFYVGAW